MKKIIQKNYVSNLNTVSALFDRFITEKIKQYFFFYKKRSKKSKISIKDHQINWERISNNFRRDNSLKKI